MVEPEDRRKLTTADGLILAALTGLLFCVYLLTASLTFVSDDELYIFDATESLAKRGSVFRSETADLDWPGESPVEPVMPLFAAPFYWLADRFEGIGNAHATLLFNGMITALTGALVYLYVRQLAFPASTALVSALAFGLGTIVWPYTKTFFRESLHMATLFTTAYCLLRWRDSLSLRSSSTLAWLLATLLAALISFFTKEAAIYALPFLLLILVPHIPLLRRNRAEWLRLGAALLGVSVLSLVGVQLFETFFNPGRFDIWSRLGLMARNLSIAQEGLIGFIFSPGKSIFLFSPPILLALVAPFVGERQRRWESIWPLILLAASILIYALIRGALWWGGTNWGPRYMVPMTPFLIVAAAPAFQAALSSKNRLYLLGLGVLLLLSLAVQLGGVSIRLSDYYEAISQVRPDAPWTIGLWELPYSGVFTNWRLIFNSPYQIDFAWLRALPGGPAWLTPLLALPLIGAFGGAIGLGLTQTNVLPLKRRVFWGTVLIGFLLTGAATWLSLHDIYYDQRYNGQNEALHPLLATLSEASLNAPDPVIFLNNRTYFTFMLNYYKGPLEWYTLPLNPNELLQPGQSRPTPDTDPTTLIDRASTQDKRIQDLVDCFGRQYLAYNDLCSGRDHATLFLIMEFGPFTPSANRPLEWWLSRNYYYRGVYEFGPTARLVEFSTSSHAPAPTQIAAHSVNYRLGDSILLTGWDAEPDTGRLRPGSTLNISTRWQALKPPGVDYKIGSYVMSPEGSVIAQDDSYPVNGFWPTLTWRVDEVVRHNIALRLPADLPPGFYEVWTLIYSPIDGVRLPVQDSSGTTILDHISLFTVEVTR